MHAILKWRTEECCSEPQMAGGGGGVNHIDPENWNHLGSMVSHLGKMAVQ